MLFWLLLLLVNLPLTMFFGWVLFDSQEEMSETFWDTLVAVLKILFVPRLVRELLDMDTTGSLGLFAIGVFFGACAIVVAGELYVLERLWPGIVPWPE